jgi:hypothetical protein
MFQVNFGEYKIMLFSLLFLLVACEVDDSTKNQEPKEKNENPIDDLDESTEDCFNPENSPTTEPSEEPVDIDGDGVIAVNDCDDTDPDLGDITEDGDCDGVLSIFDCDDEDATTTMDMDCDDIPTTEDCDDNDPNSTIIAEDADCDDSSTTEDCDDTDPSIYPNAPDIWYDGIDSDCQGNNDYDQDGDGYVGEEYVEDSGLLSGDCNDEEEDVNAGMTDESIDGIDQNCDGIDGVDNDGDGIVDINIGGDDCDDNDDSLGSILEDADCDGIIMVDDCDDFDSQITDCPVCVDDFPF